MNRYALALSTGFVLGVAAFAQSQEAQFLEAYRIFQSARNGDKSQVGPAIAAFEALARGEPQQPLYAAYLGAAATMRGRDAWMPWNKVKYTEQGLDSIDAALAALKPEHDRQRLRGVPAGMEAQLVAASTFLDLPDAIFHRRPAARKLIEGLLRHSEFATTPAEFRVAVHVEAAKAARGEGQAAEERAHLERVLSLATSGREADSARARLMELAP